MLLQVNLSQMLGNYHVAISALVKDDEGTRWVMLGSDLIEIEDGTRADVGDALYTLAGYALKRCQTMNEGWLRTPML